MTLLVLNRRAIVEMIPQWLADLDERLILVTARSADTSKALRWAHQHYHSIYAVDQYDDPSVDDLALEVARRHQVKRVLSSAEIDVMRAARIRECLSLAGRTCESARAFRDKFLMKTLVAQAGLAITPMRLVSRPEDIHMFCREHGFPVVMKPTMGGGSAGVHVLADEAEASSYVERFMRHQEKLPEQRYMIEAWIEGDFYAADGLMASGEVLQIAPSRTTANHNVVMGSSMMSWMVLESDPVGMRIKQFVASVVSALPAVDEINAFHAEVFHTRDDRLLLCEIACRPGGCGHAPVYERAFGVNLYAASLRGQAGAAVSASSLMQPARCMAGFGWFPPRCGVLGHVPSTCPVPGVDAYFVNGKPGLRYEGAHSVADKVAWAQVSGPVSQDLKPRIDALEAWWMNACRWD